MKTILVTGANSGIGLSIVQLFLTKGYRVIAHYHRHKDKLNSINNTRLILLQANLSNLDESTELILNAFKISSTIDILVNNAGVYLTTNSFSDQTIDILDSVLNVNLKAPFILSKEYIKRMQIHRYGKIINISSIGVKYGGSPLASSYTISKAALEQMTLNFAKEAAQYNILVNALRVGVVNTPFHQGKNLEKRIEMIPLKKLLEPEEIAEYILFLGSEKNNFSTGSIITIAGGE